MENKKIVTVLVPAYNEQEVIKLLYERLKKVIDENEKYNFEILIIDDGSKDETLNIIMKLRKQDKRINYLSLSRNFGKEVAMLAGFDYTKGDCVIIMDADLQNPPEVIPEMLKYWEDGYDDVYAKRKSRKGESFLKRISSKIYCKILQNFTKIEIQKDAGDFRLLDKRCVEALRKIREQNRYTKGLVSWIGYNKKEIYYDHESRVAGKTHWSYKELVRLAMNGITSFTTVPLKWSSILGFIIIFLACIGVIFTLIQNLVLNIEISEYFLLMLVILFLSGIQFIFLGIIGEYLGRTFYETRNRPLYFVDKYNEQKEDNK